jgi:hypothetical protein
MQLPTTKTLQRIKGVDIKKARELRKLLESDTPYDEIMDKANEIIGGFGTEVIWGDFTYWPEIEYVNMGDTYDTTLLMFRDWDSRSGVSGFRVCDWGTIVERKL